MVPFETRRRRNDGFPFDIMERDDILEELAFVPEFNAIIPLLNQGCWWPRGLAACNKATLLKVLYAVIATPQTKFRERAEEKFVSFIQKFKVTQY